MGTALYTRLDLKSAHRTDITLILLKYLRFLRHSLGKRVHHKCSLACACEQGAERRRRDLLPSSDKRRRRKRDRLCHRRSAPRGSPRRSLRIISQSGSQKIGGPFCGSLARTRTLKTTILISCLAIRYLQRSTDLLSPTSRLCRRGRISVSTLLEGRQNMPMHNSSQGLIL